MATVAQLIARLESARRREAVAKEKHQAAAQERKDLAAQLAEARAAAKK